MTSSLATSVAVAFTSALCCFWWAHHGYPVDQTSSTSVRTGDPAQAVKESLLASKNCHTIKFCSHRGRGSPFQEASEEAILFLLEKNITCFDLDVFESVDGILFVGHPKSLAEMKPKLDVTQLTTKQLLSTFGSTLLSVDRLLHILASLRNQERSSIRVTLEPKAPPDDLQILQALSTLIQQHGLAATVSVIVIDGAGVPSRGQGSPDALALLRRNGVIPAVAVHSQQEATPPPTSLRAPPSEVQTALFAFEAIVHPHIFNLTARVRSGRQVVVYGNEDATRVEEGLARGASAFISDDPLRLRAAWLRLPASQCRGSPEHSQSLLRV